MIFKQTDIVVTPTEYANYNDNCNGNHCDLPFAAPLPSIDSVILFADFEDKNIVEFEIHIVDTCQANRTEQALTNTFVIGQTPRGNFYGVFKNLQISQLFSSFVLFLKVTGNGSGDPLLNVRTYFTQEMELQACNKIMDIRACFPQLNTDLGFDVNGIYYGFPTGTEIIGNRNIRYFHRAWVRYGKMKEIGNTITFTSSLIRTFRSVVEKKWQFECEIVPKWFKDILLSIFSRGVIQVDGKFWLMEELDFQALNEDDLMWKPYAIVLETFKLYFGCDDSACLVDAPACCDIVIEDVSLSPECCSLNIINISYANINAKEITITFSEECPEILANGYILRYRIAGSNDPFIIITGITSSPFVLTINDSEPECTNYEGTLQTDCGNNIVGTEIQWTTVGVECVQQECFAVQNNSQNETITGIQWKDCGGRLRNPTGLTPGSSQCFGEYITDEGGGIPIGVGECGKAIFILRNEIVSLSLNIFSPEHTLAHVLTPVPIGDSTGFIVGGLSLISASVNIQANSSNGGTCNAYINNIQVGTRGFVGGNNRQISIDAGSVVPGDNFILEFLNP